MTGEHDSIDKVLDAMSNDTPISWDSAGLEAGPEARPRIETLRQISTIASFSRVLQRRHAPDRAQTPPPGSEIPDKWGGLLVLERIGVGSRVQVYRAWDPALQRDVALKLFAPGVQPRQDLPLAALSQLLAGIRHPNLVAVHGVDFRDDRLGVWVNLRAGTTLDQDVYVRGALAPSAVARLGSEIAAALVAVHNAGLSHRNITIKSVVRDREGRYVLAEPGVAGDAANAGMPHGPATEDPGLAGARRGQLADLYALGQVLWFAAAGRHPQMEPAGRISIPALHERIPEFPAPLADLIVRTLDLPTAGSFESAGHLEQALRSCEASAVTVEDSTHGVPPVHGARFMRRIAALRTLWPVKRKRD